MKMFLMVTDENENKVIETKGEIKSKTLKKNHIMN